MWDKRSHLSKPLTSLKPKKVTFKQTVVEQKAFNDIKQIVALDTLLIYPDFNKSFDIHTYAIELQLGAVKIKDSKQIEFYSHKLTE